MKTYRIIRTNKAGDNSIDFVIGNTYCGNGEIAIHTSTDAKKALTLSKDQAEYFVSAFEGENGLEFGATISEVN
jgi:hypothetical protein